MHILFVTGEYPPMQGGVGAYTAELARALVEQGIQASVLTATQAAFDVPYTAHVPIYPVIDRWDLRIWRAIPRWIGQLGADWVHIQYQTAAFAMNPAINLGPWWWQRNRTFRVAWTYHDLLVPYLFPKAGARLRRWITQQPAHTCNLVVATNSGDYEQLARILCEPGREEARGSTSEIALLQTHTPGKTNPEPVLSEAEESKIRNPEPLLARIPIGSNITGRTLTAEERRARRDTRGYTEQQLVIAYFGFLNRSKGGTTLIRVLHRLVTQGHDARLLMIGERVGASDPTNYAYLQEIEALILDQDMSERVQWTGRQDDADVAADLNASDVLLMPYEDGASLRRGTLMAGLANGCAIVTTTPQAPLPELVHECHLLYIPPADIEAACAAVHRLIHEPDLATKLRTNARSASQRFTWEAIAQEHVRLYSAGGRVPHLG